MFLDVNTVSKPKTDCWRYWYQRLSREKPQADAIRIETDDPCETVTKDDSSRSRIIKKQALLSPMF
jgi:hypothetical protein